MALGATTKSYDKWSGYLRPRPLVGFVCNKNLGWAPKSHPIICIKVGWAPSAHPIKHLKVGWDFGAHPTFLSQTKPTSGLDLRCPDQLSYDLVVAPRATTGLQSQSNTTMRSGQNVPDHFYFAPKGAFFICRDGFCKQTVNHPRKHLSKTPFLCV